MFYIRLVFQLVCRACFWGGNVSHIINSMKAVDIDIITVVVVVVVVVIISMITTDSTVIIIILINILFVIPTRRATLIQSPVCTDDFLYFNSSVPISPRFQLTNSFHSFISFEGVLRSFAYMYSCILFNHFSL